MTAFLTPNLNGLDVLIVAVILALAVLAAFASRMHRRVEAAHEAEADPSVWTWPARPPDHAVARGVRASYDGLTYRKPRR